MPSQSEAVFDQLGDTRFAVLKPAGSALPLCLVLLGGGGTRDHLIQLQPRFDAWWASGAIPPMVLACPTGDMSYYHGWEPFVFDEFLPHLQSAYGTGPTVAFGMSMGGYGALKFAFHSPSAFRAVAAMQPVLEPALTEIEVSKRNRIHHIAGGPADLIGATRSAAAVEAANPANRALANAEAIRGSGLAIYLECGGDDVINAQDGAEFLHRMLWDQDIEHEYHLLAGADHVGESIVPRMKTAFEWLGRQLQPPAADAAAATLRLQLAPVRDQVDDKRRYGRLG